jgi:4-hydroxybenzoate polyprenyltransferase
MEVNMKLEGWRKALVAFVALGLGAVLAGTDKLDTEAVALLVGVTGAFAAGNGFEHFAGRRKDGDL